MKFKKIFTLSLCALVGFTGKAQVVSIPDEIFLEYLLLYTDVDSNLDGEIQVSEAEAFTGTINVFNSAVKDLTGIEAFKNITGLQISRTAIPKLDISNNTKLQALYATSTLIDKIDISHNMDLVQIEAQYNENLKTFVTGSSTYTQFQSLNLSYNLIENVDVSKMPYLNSLNVLSNKLTTLDVSKNPRLILLSTGSNQLTSLDVTKNTRLMTLGIGLNQISQIDLSKNKQLDIFNCNGNPLTQLDLTNNIYLSQLLMDNTQVTEIDLSALEMLGYVNANATKLKQINLSNSPIIELQASDSLELEYVNMKNGNTINALLCITRNNPKLRCIEVDDPQYSENADLWEKDETATYTTNCALLSASEVQNGDNLTIYPNPVADVLRINEKIHSAVVMNSAGQTVLTANDTEQINVAHLPAGVYILKIQQRPNGAYLVKKLIKK